MTTIKTTEDLNLAKTTNSAELLHRLKDSFNSNVRRAVARNKSTSQETLEVLAFDPVENVSFMAVANPKCTINREFPTAVNPCIFCEKDEREINCLQCDTLSNFYDELCN